MDFTYLGYETLLKTLSSNGYSICSYSNWEELDSCVILRHDIDTSIEYAVKMAEFEAQRGYFSTYFVLLTSNFYNVFSRESKQMLNIIRKCGHDIGLHFDEVQYPGLPIDALKQKISDECTILEQALQEPIHCVSMHRPSKEMLEADLEIPGIVNSYSRQFFKEFKYLSDSRRRWREPVFDIVNSREFKRLHILTHAFWYHDNELDIHDSILQFICSANSRCYSIMQENITDLASIMKKEEVING